MKEFLEWRSSCSEMSYPEIRSPLIHQYDKGAVFFLSSNRMAHAFPTKGLEIVECLSGLLVRR